MVPYIRLDSSTDFEGSSLYVIYKICATTGFPFNTEG